MRWWPAALAFNNTTTATGAKRTLDAGSKSYTYYTDEPRGIVGGLVSVAATKPSPSCKDLTVASDVTVPGLLVDKDTQTVTNFGGRPEGREGPLRCRGGLSRLKKELPLAQRWRGRRVLAHGRHPDDNER